jgi:hypothetical protein
MEDSMAIDLIDDDHDLIVFNGVNGATGQPITKSLNDLAEFIKNESIARPPEKEEEAKLLEQVKDSGQARFGLPINVSDETDLKQTG